MNQQAETINANTVEVKEPVVAQVSDVTTGRGPMSRDEQTAALKKAQQAEKRVRLGMELLKASESRLSQQTQMLNQVRGEQKALREQIQDDVAKSLQTYDQWLGQIDESFSKAIMMLEQKVDAVVEIWEKKEQKLDQMIQRFERLHEQNHRTMFEMKMQLAAVKDEGRSGDEAEMSAEEEAEIYRILKGEVEYKDGEATEVEEKQVEKTCSANDASKSDVEDQDAEDVANDDAVDPAAALAEMADQRQQVNVYSTVLKEMQQHKKK